MKTWAMSLAVLAALIPQVALAQWPTSTPEPTEAPEAFVPGAFQPAAIENWTIDFVGAFVYVTATLRSHTSAVLSDVALSCDSSPGERVTTIIPAVPSDIAPGAAAVAAGSFPVSKTSRYIYGCRVQARIGAPVTVATPTDVLPTLEPTTEPTLTPPPTWTLPATVAPTVVPTEQPVPWHAWLPHALTPLLVE